MRVCTAQVRPAHLRHFLQNINVSRATYFPVMNAFQRFAARLFFGSSSVFENANNSPRRARVPGAAPRDACKDMPTPVRSELVRRSRYLVKNSGFLREIVSSMALYASRPMRARELKHGPENPR